MNAIMKWSGTQWIVQISDLNQVIECPLDDFLELPAIKVIVRNAISEAGQRPRAKRISTAGARRG